MKTRQIIIATVTVAIIFTGLLMNAWLKSMAKDPPQKPPTIATRYVKVTPVVYDTLTTYVEGTGRVQSGQTISLVAEVQGKIQQGDFPLRQGQSFKAGQLIYKIDDTEARFNLSAEKSRFLNAIATILPDIKLDYSSAYPAWQQYFDELNIDKDLPPLPEIENTKLKTFLAGRSILNLYYAIKSGEERLRKYAYYAPYDGAIAMVQLEPGSVANPGAVIGQIIKTGRLEVEIPVQEVDLKWISLGAAVQLGEQATNHKVKGKVIRISDFLDPATQSFNIYVGINKDDHSLYDGQYLNASITGKEISDVMEIPRKALINKQEVYTVMSDSLLIAAKVEVVKLGSNEAIITGLKEGTQLVIEPVVNGRDSLLVTPVKAGS